MKALSNDLVGLCYFGNMPETTITGLIPLINGTYACTWERNVIEITNDRGRLIYSTTVDLSVKGKKNAVLTVKDFVAKVRTADTANNTGESGF